MTAGPQSTQAPDPAPERVRPEKAWALLPTVVVRSAGFGWQLVDGLREVRSAPLLQALCDALDRAEAVREGLTASSRLSRGQAARVRNLRPLPPGTPVPADWLDRWNTAVDDAARARQAWLDARAGDEQDAVAALAALAADPRVRDALVCSGPGVFRDLDRAGRTSTVLPSRLRRQLASYAQRLSTKCETMSFFGPINYATVDPELPGTPGPSWAGPQACTERRAMLSAWAFHALLNAVLDEPVGDAPGPGSRLVDQVIPRRTTFAHSSRGDDPVSRLVRAADGVTPLAGLLGPAGLTPQEGRQALDDAVRLGRLSHDLIPAAVLPDPVRWLAGQLESMTGRGGAACSAPARERVRGVVELLHAYPDAVAETKLGLQDDVRRLVAPGPGTPITARGAAASSKFYNDRVAVTEAAAGTLELTIGGDLARDLHSAVPAALGLLAEAAVRTRRRCGRALARSLGPGRFPLLKVLAEHGQLPVPVDPRLPTALAELAADAPAGTSDLDLAELLPAPSAPDLPILASADVMVAVADLNAYHAGRTPLVVGDVHDAALLTPWALQFHPDAEALLADRDTAIEWTLAGRRAVTMIARRTTGLPPLRFPGPVVELGTVDGAAERLALDRLLVHSDGESVHLRAAGDARDLFLHNGELDSFVHTALALPRVRPLPLPDLAHVPRLRHGNVVLARRRWRLYPGPLTGFTRPPRDADERIALRRALVGDGVPTRFFAKAPHQRKPLYVDLDSPLLVEALFRLLAGADRLHAAEALPGPGALWLHHNGLDVAAELRCVYLRRPGSRA